MYILLLCLLFGVFMIKQCIGSKEIIIPVPKKAPRLWGEDIPSCCLRIGGGGTEPCIRTQVGWLVSRLEALPTEILLGSLALFIRTSFFLDYSLLPQISEVCDINHGLK